MKTPNHYIKFDQGYLHYQREQQAKRERMQILAFAGALLVIGTGAVWLTLTIAAKVM